MSEVKELVKELMHMEKIIVEEIKKTEKIVKKQEEQVAWLRNMLKDIEDNLFNSKAKLIELKDTIEEENSDKYQSVINNNKDYFSV
jgi:predicted  nucleic acid-binding Zn-ribbon protein|tara:strand:- start:376 stop:633 length:258 start_codon:yes stop_codon:yes gene_type:complete